MNKFVFCTVTNQQKKEEDKNERKKEVIALALWRKPAYEQEANETMASFQW